jgi:IclR family acetate operon transcriptional repressor
MFSFTPPISPVVIALSPNKTKMISTIQKKESRWSLPFPLNAAENLLPPPPAGGQVQSLTRGLKLLEWIAESHSSVALTELAQQAGLPNSTTHRLLTTMQQLGFVRQVGELGHWAVGAHAFIVGSSFLQSRNLLAIVHPILRKLMEDSGETVNLAVLDQSDHQAIIIDQVQCTQLMRMSAPIGGKLPMHASGAGRRFSRS